LREKYHLTLTSRSRPGRTYEGIAFVQADLACYDEIAACVENQDAIVHLASVLNNRLELPAAAFADAMVKGAWHIAEACVRHGVQRVIHVSSILACGQPGDPTRVYRTGDPSVFLKQDLLYPLAKHLAEEIFDGYHAAYDLPVIHLRPGVIAGDPRYPLPVRPAALKPQQLWFRHVDPRDVAQAIDAALTSPRVHGCYHLLAGRADAMFDWRTAVEELGYSPAHNWPEIPDNYGDCHDAG
jgi:nucleoside-diphosphate-sugar epimerase